MFEAVEGASTSSDVVSKLTVRAADATRALRMLDYFSRLQGKCELKIMQPIKRQKARNIVKQKVQANSRV